MYITIKKDIFKNIESMLTYTYLYFSFLKLSYFYFISKYNKNNKEK